MIRISNIGKSLPIIRRLEELRERVMGQCPKNPGYTYDLTYRFKMSKVSSAFTAPTAIKEDLAKYGLTSDDCDLGQVIGYLWCIPVHDIDTMNNFLEGYEEFLTEIAPRYWPYTEHSCDFLRNELAYVSPGETMTYGHFLDTINKFIENIKNPITVGEDCPISLKTLNTNRLIYFIERMEQCIENYSRINNKLMVDMVNVDLTPITEECGTPGCHAGWIRIALPELQKITSRMLHIHDPKKVGSDYDFSITAAAFSLWLFDLEEIAINEEDASDILETFFPKFRHEIWPENPQWESIGIRRKAVCFPWSDPQLYGQTNNIFSVNHLLVFWKRVLNAAQVAQSAPANS